MLRRKSFVTNNCKNFCPNCRKAAAMNNTNYINHSTNQNHSAVNEAMVAGLIKMEDYGPEPFVVDIEKATKQNNNFRTALWTGDFLQLTLMSIDVGGDIGLEMHPDLDQFIRIEEGQGLVKMGDREDNLYFQKKVSEDFAIFIPAGTWHNLINTGNKPIKLYSIYAPPEHPWGTVHETQAAAEAAEQWGS